MSCSFASTEVLRARLFADHQALRSLAAAVRTTACFAPCDEMQRQRIRGTLAQLCAQIERHIALEEQELAPLLRIADAWGEVRVDLMAREHAEQRSVLVAVSEDAEDGSHPIDELVDELVWFAQRVERAIEDEQRRLLTAEALGDELIVIDQTDG